jgi:heme exporter protein C
MKTKLGLLSFLALIAVLIGLYFALVYAGTDSIQGNIQRIFYLHLPAFFGAVLGFGCALICGIAYLTTRNTKWDMISLSAIEVGLMLAIVTLASGSIWARPTWNTWWTDSPRLSSTLIMALTYAAYLFLRQGFILPEKQRKFAAIYAILAFSTVIFTMVIVRVRSDGIHPVVIGSSPQNTQGGFAMSDTMKAALFVNMGVWVFLVTPTLIWWRVRLEQLHVQVKAPKTQFVSEPV